MKGSPILITLVRWANIASGYLLALGLSWCASEGRYRLEPELEGRSRTLLFIPVVLVCAWYGGVGPGILAICLGTYLTVWTLIPHLQTINLSNRSDRMELILFLLIGSGIVFLVHRERVEKRKHEKLKADLETANASLEERVKVRTLELEVANQELEGFCYNVSHDLRTPTRSIVGNAHILIEDYGEDLSPPVRDKLKRISAAALKLSDFVDALLVYARLAKSGLKKEVVNLNELIKSEVEVYERRTNKSIRVDIGAPIMAYGDQKLLGVALEAIISNAGKYHKENEEAILKVKFQRSGSNLILSFKDEGIGFDPQYLQKIFEPFQRLHRDEDYTGVGMGLANVARIASRHNGSAWAKSTRGHGATFFLSLGDQPESLSAKTKKTHLPTA